MPIRCLRESKLCNFRIGLVDVRACGKSPESGLWHLSPFCSFHTALGTTLELVPDRLEAGIADGH